MNRIVYSSESGGQPANRKDDGAERVAPALSDHGLRIARESKGRRGKTVTQVGPFRQSRAEVARLLRDLKRRLGTGGTLVEESMPEGAAFSLVIQGDRVEEVRTRLAELGYRLTAN